MVLSLWLWAIINWLLGLILTLRFLGLTRPLCISVGHYGPVIMAVCLLLCITLHGRKRQFKHSQFINICECLL